ncbi:hypothetical protein [Sinomonas terrae]|uniref:Uncharacterized protein n=1 Tax=Sinomonas terrae TaxID=2908838 RepID=A0ABS9U038_9MICC|nr:hypothetical protein [Sinomonas terrae]MCH6470073.1 hypothetical protein [Sinomonas terrae]
MTITAVTEADMDADATKSLSIWGEGFAASGQSEGAWRLNEAPVLDASCDEAVALFAHASSECRRDGSLDPLRAAAASPICKLANRRGPRVDLAILSIRLIPQICICKFLQVGWSLTE